MSGCGDQRYVSSWVCAGTHDFVVLRASRQAFRAIMAWLQAAVVPWWWQAACLIRCTTHTYRQVVASVDTITMHRNVIERAYGSCWT